MRKCQLVGFERHIAKLFEQKKIKCPIHLSGGNEDILIALFKDIKPKDYVFSTHRSHYHYLLKTGDFKGLKREILGSSFGMCRGLGGSMHIINHKKRFYSSSIVAGCVPIAVGVAMGIAWTGGKGKVWCFVGDGACDEGWFWSSLRYAKANNLPITFVVENNDRSVESSIKHRWGKHDNLQECLLPYANYVEYYEYIPTYPHAGTGKWVSFL